MTILLTIVAMVGAVLALVFGTLYVTQVKALERAQSDCDGRVARLQHDAAAAITRTEQEAAAKLARFQTIVNAESYVADLQGRAKQWEQYIAGQERHWAAKAASLEQELASRLAALQVSVASLEQEVTQRNETLARLQQEISAVEEALDLQSFGFYEPRYNLGSSQQYKARLDTCRAKQKRMVSDGDACSHAKEWLVEGSAAKGKQMMREQQKLMLSAFNGEADAMIAKVRFSNVVTYENRLRKSFDSINKLGRANECSISPHYLDLKLEELHLVYEHACRVQAEKEEQQRIKEQMQEEAKAEAELKKAIDQADKDELTATKALLKAKAELEAAAGLNEAQVVKLQTAVDGLESRLKEALDRKAKAIARAQLTRSGHVYILSNIGSFGPDIFKIGLTRRLDPQERVDELASASVPFPFDVHAMIYSEDAPALEHALHQHFDGNRVNLVNSRKEYFHIKIDDVIQAVGQLHGQITFVTDPVAEEFRQTIAKRRAQRSLASGVAPSVN